MAEELKSGLPDIVNQQEFHKNEPSVKKGSLDQWMSPDDQVNQGIYMFSTCQLKQKTAR